MFTKSIISTALVFAVSICAAQETAKLSPEAQLIRDTVKAKNPDFKAFCLQGPEKGRSAIMTAVGDLMRQQKLKGDPTAHAMQAGAATGEECEVIRKAQ